MKLAGKILFFNENEGRGILITASKKKLNFFVQEWDDFDVMPSLGLEVFYDEEHGQATKIISKSTYESEAMPSDESLACEDVYEALSEPHPSEQIVEEHCENQLQQLREDVIQEVVPDDVVIFPEEKLEEEQALNSFDDDESVVDLPEDVVVFPDEEEDEEAEEEVEEASQIEEIVEEEEIAEREESITLSYSLSTAVANYFNNIKKHIQTRQAYKKVTGRLDYLIARRFIWTTYNNLSEIDLHIVTPKIKMLADDLKIMGRVYDDFNNKAKNPSLAFAEVFLACQAEYNKIREGAEKVQEKLNTLRTNEQMIHTKLRVKKEELDKNIKSDEFELLKHEFKSLNGAYVDVVHMMAELDERYKHDLELLHNFEEEYRSDFYKIFAEETRKYRASLIEILSAQAFIFDAQLWQQAKASKSVKAYFKRSAIVGELNTKTYLKYYLDSLDSTKAGDEAKKLFELYEYLIATHKEYIMVMASDAQDVMEYEGAIKRADKTYHVKSFIDEKAAIKWAINNTVKVLVLEEQLRNTNAGRFLEVYYNNVLVKPKIVLIGNKPKLSENLTINKLLMQNSSPKVVAESVKSVLDEK